MSFDAAAGNGWAAVVVNYNAGVFLDGCLRALYGGTLPPAEVVVVDNASTDDSLTELAGWPQVVVEASPTNLGFAGGANRGIARTEAPLLVVLNPDVDLDPGYGLALLQAFAADVRLGAAGGKLRYPDGKVIQHAGGVVEYPLLTTHHRGYGETDHGQWDEPADVDFVTGGALAVRRAAFDTVAGFDESFYPTYYEDVDLCFRLRDAGWRVAYAPELSGTHFESVTLGRSPEYYRLFHRSRLRFALKHLAPEAWWREFIPAEIERLRGELSAVEDADWPVRGGAEAIEALARLGSIPRGDAPPAIRGEPLASTITSLREVRQRATIHPPVSEPGTSWRRRARRWLNRLSARAHADKLFWRQQAFNDAVVRMLEAQDRLNRELTAQLLLALLDLGGRGDVQRSFRSMNGPAPSVRPDLSPVRDQSAPS